jgi:hypothetical protein
MHTYWEEPAERKDMVSMKAHKMVNLCDTIGIATAHDDLSLHSQRVLFIAWAGSIFTDISASY